MKWLALVVLMLAAPVVAGEVGGSIFFDTGPFACNGIAHQSSWTNTNPWPMYFLRGRLWHGRDYGVIADYDSRVYKYNGALMAIFQQDAYGIDAPRIQDTDYGAGNYQILAPGESMTLVAWCKAMNGTSGNAHVTGTFWWTGPWGIDAR